MAHESLAGDVIRRMVRRSQIHDGEMHIEFTAWEFKNQELPFQVLTT